MKSVINSTSSLRCASAFARTRLHDRARAGRPILLILLFVASGCADVSGPPANPPAVTVTVEPAAASVLLGQTEQFQASVAGTSNTSVTWEVNGASGGNASVGTISASGLYTAPSVMPSPSAITVSAVSQADPQAAGSATVTLEDNIQVSVSPSSGSVPAGAAQVLTATVSGTGNLTTAVTWSVNGIAGGNSTLGTIVTNGMSGATTTGLYTAPAVAPPASTVTVTAASVADTSKSASATITIVCAATNSISPSAAQVSLGQTQALTASFCLAQGTAIAWDVNGVAGGNAAVGTVASTGASAALYTAPADLPATNPVTVHARGTVAAGGSIAASASITVLSNVSVSVLPASATIQLSGRSSFSAAVANTSDTSVTWSVNGIPDGNAAIGQVCVSGTNPCAPPAGPISGPIDFLAPASVPATNPEALVATSHADPSRSGIAVITIAGPTGSVSVTVSPPYAFVPPSGATLSTQQFFAAVTNAPSAGVTWSVQSAVAGQGCAGAACGSVDANGVYYAPTIAPSPNAISVVATSVADPTKSASATVALTSGPAIEKILPSSVFSGAVESFPLAVQGVGFVAGSGGGASAILLNGAQQATTCATATSCITSLDPVDVQSAGTLTIQIQNPGPPPVLSNPVPFVIEPFIASQAALSLTPAQPTATAQNVIVTDPTTAAESSPINVDFIGLLTGGNNCGVQGSPLTVTRPASGSAVTSICVHGTGLDPTFAYQFTGPGDIGITASAITGLFPNIIELDLQLSSATLPGVRSLVITTPNNDDAVATGMLEVQ